ncbi:GGDEF domain-containing phosphodiesterase [Marinobacter profundi]|uniref:GGDEF domain-containing protein n=1 Tax=Marinobacter profundi TaxID=2666256 RepID=A0A2G1UPI9_9GAMM|nr:GGDEF domain-containing phosphodiesterase [Marinobacter profundi]PHQ16416.1 hypothetical protein CLH61_04920 [Marinobacter profundi]
MKLIQGGKSESATGEPRPCHRLPTSGSFLYAKIFCALPYPALVIDLASREVADVNDRALEALDCFPSEVSGADFYDLFGLAETCRAPGLALADVFDPDNPAAFSLLFEPAGRSKMFCVDGRFRVDQDGRGYLVLVLAANHEPVRLSAFPGYAPGDYQAGAGACWRNLETVAKARLRDGEYFAVAMFSLDDCRAKLTGFGEQLTTSLLTALTDRLDAALPGNVAVFRYSRDEYLLVFENTRGLDDAMELAFQALSSKIVIHDLLFSVAVSGGIYVSRPGDDLSPEVLVSKARKALDRARLEGGGHYLFFSELGVRKADLADLYLQTIRRAFYEGEFSLHFQPVVSLQDDRVNRVEAVLRWQHPESDVLKPVEFLDAIKGTALYEEAGEWLVNRALVTLERWAARGIPLSLSVNITGDHLATPGCIERLTTMLSRHNAEVVSRLELEIVESRLADEVLALGGPLRSLRKLGVRVTLVDAGDGSFDTLQRFSAELDRVKVESDLVENLEEDLASMFIVRRIIVLANELGLPVAAKGVERQDQLKLLQALGCVEVQGNLISEPLGELALIEFCREHRLRNSGDTARHENHRFVALGRTLSEHRTMFSKMLDETVCGQTILPGDQDSVRMLQELLHCYQSAQGVSPSQPRRPVSLREQNESLQDLQRQVDGGPRAGTPNPDLLKASALLLSELISTVDSFRHPAC